MHGVYRPFGCSIILAVHDCGKDDLYMIEPSGKCYGYRGCTAGKNKQITKNELEKGDFINKTCKEALPLISKMCAMGNKDAREKRFEFEASWITADTNRVHQFVAKNLRVEAKTWADEEIEKEAYGEDD